MEAAEEIRAEGHAGWGNTCEQAAEAILALLDERDRLLSQLPEEMKECAIIHKQCEIGHSWLTATNWVQHDCLRCESNRLREALNDSIDEMEEVCEHAKTIRDEYAKYRINNPRSNPNAI
jgi:hypothetical protein